MRAPGSRRPRIAVAGFNPHAGDGGNFGREEIDVDRAGGRGSQGSAASAVEGPFPSDTVFLRAKRGDFDAVLTMYHDQGQIAMKLIGFDTRRDAARRLPLPDLHAGARHGLRHRRHRASPISARRARRCCSPPAWPQPRRARGRPRRSLSTPSGMHARLPEPPFLDTDTAYQRPDHKGRMPSEAEEETDDATTHLHARSPCRRRHRRTCAGYAEAQGEWQPTRKSSSSSRPAPAAAPTISPASSSRSSPSTS